MPSVKAFILYVPGPIREFYQSECLKTEVSYFSTKKSSSLKLYVNFDASDKNHLAPLHRLLPTNHIQFLELSKTAAELDGMAYQVNSFQFLQIEMCLNE